MRSIVISICLFVSFSIVGCGGSAATGNGGGGGGTGGGGTDQAVVSLSASTLTFGTVGVGATSTPQTLTLTNTGDIPLTLNSFSVDDADSGFFPISSTGNCTAGTRVSAGASCTVIVSFAPTPAQTYSGTLTFSDSAADTPQTVILTGTGTSTVATATLSTNSIYFGSVTTNATTPASTVTLTNTGGVPLTITSIALGGTNAAAFAETNTCGTSVAVSSNCTISVTFTPTAASSYNATLTITDNSSTGTTQTVALSGLGASSGGGGGGSSTSTLYVIPEADNSVTPLYALVNNAHSTIDMTMYALQDTTFTNDLVTACGRGVKVRVILDQNSEKSSNTSAYNTLNATTNCSAVWANKAFQVTHQKTITIDGTTTAIMSLNLQSRYYSTTRDFAYVETDANDIAGIQATFNADYAAGTPSSGTAGASDYTYTPPTGDDLIWSPTTAKTEMTNIIANAQHTILLENEEMASSASYILSALETACHNGLTVQIAMVNQSSYASSFAALKSAGCSVHLYPDTTSGFYIHAKAVVADYGLSTQKVYMGSINYSNASMTENRELGLYIPNSDTASISLLESTMTSDFAGGTPY